MKKLSVHAAFH